MANFSVQWRVLLEGILGGILGIVFGFIVDLLFGLTDGMESAVKLVGLIIAQLLANIIVVWFILMISEYIHIFNTNDHAGIIGFLLFTVILFTVQTQLQKRLLNLYNKIKPGRIQID